MIIITNQKFFSMGRAAPSVGGNSKIHPGHIVD